MQKIEWTHPPCLPLHTLKIYIYIYFTIHVSCSLNINLNSNSKSFSWCCIGPIFILKQDTRKCFYKALCHVSFLFSLLSLLFNPVTSAPWAGEVGQRLSHGLRANPTLRALPEGRPSVRSVWSVLGGKASAAWPNSTFQHTPPSWRKAQSIHSTRHPPRTHTHTHT